LTQGLAPDGGLYMPEAWPSIPLAAFNGVSSLPDVAAVMLKPFVEGDAVAAQVGEIVRDAFDFPAPLVPVADDGKLSVLELFHGPTAAFKDFGARFLAASVARLRAQNEPGRLRKPDTRPLNILVATSGDTGGAVAAAFHRRPGVRSTSWSPRPATPGVPSPPRSIAGPASSCPCCSRRAWCRRRRSASSRAGATTCTRTA
jgi:threonine synthase